MTDVLARAGGVPEARAEHQPIGNHQLEFTLGKDDGSGVHVLDGPQTTSPLVVPELRGKVCISRERLRRSEIEAACYEELFNLQGQVIPKCYGWFRGKIETGWTIVFDRWESSAVTDDQEIAVLLVEHVGKCLSETVNWNWSALDLFK